MYKVTFVVSLGSASTAGCLRILDQVIIKTLLIITYYVLFQRSVATQQARWQSCGSGHTAQTRWVSDAARGQRIRTGSRLR